MLFVNFAMYCDRTAIVRALERASEPIVHNPNETRINDDQTANFPLVKKSC